MSVIKLVENYAVAYARQCVQDSLAWNGEEAILLQMYHPDDQVQRCPRCSTDAYQQGQQKCPVCYGTNFYDDTTQTGGVKMARRAWCLFGDHIVSEQYGQYGTIKPDTRQVQFEAFPMLTEHDFIVRVKTWDTETHTVLEVGGFYQVDAVTRDSLRTGNRYGQTWEDVIGQTAQCSWIPPKTLGICEYPVLNKVFPRFSISEPLQTGEPMTFTQTTPSAFWQIQHNLGHYPVVQVIVNGEEVSGDIAYPNINLVTITFQTPQAGIAELV